MSETSEPAEGQVPHRELGDPGVLRALAHPVRLEILDELLTRGPLTATELGERLGESAANCSWHLRQLAKHGFIEEAEGGTGRQRPWRFRAQVAQVAAPEEPGTEFTAARDALVEVLLARDLAAWRRWRDTRHTEPEPWRSAGFTSQTNYCWLTADELAALEVDVKAAVERHLVSRVERVDPQRRPEGSRPIRFLALGVPGGEPHQSGPDGVAQGEESHASGDQ